MEENFKNSDYIFFIQEKNKKNIPLFSNFSLQDHNCGLVEWNTLYRNVFPMLYLHPTRACAPCSPAPCFLRLRDTLLRCYVRQLALRCANQSGGNNYAVYSVAGCCCSLPVTTSFNTQCNTDIRSTTVRGRSGEIKSS